MVQIEKSLITHHSPSYLNWCTSVSLIIQVDTTQLEERHRKQLLDLEEAMKSTWEAKSKVQLVCGSNLVCLPLTPHTAIAITIAMTVTVTESLEVLLF